MTSKKKIRLCSRILLHTSSSILLAFFLVNFILVQFVFAQSGSSGWSTPARLLQIEGHIYTFVLLSDDYGKLHIFYTDQEDPSEKAIIYYFYWDGENWSIPLDILIDPQADIPNLLRAAIDANQVIHLVWLGNLNQLRYSSALLNEAGAVKAWSEPDTLATSIGGRDILAGKDGSIYIAYPDWPAMGTISIIRSEDSGETWSIPVIAATSALNTVPGDIRLAMDGAGRLHMVWTEYSLSEGNEPQGAFYTRSVTAGESWESPVRLSEKRHGQPGVGVVGNDETHLVWRSNIGGDGTFHQWSNDGGENWFYTDRFDDSGGFSGSPSFVTDSKNNLHYVIGPVKYASFENGALSDYLDLVPPEIRNQAQVSDGEGAKIAMTNGNRLHVIFHTDFNNIWHTSMQLNLPLIPTSTFLPGKSSTPSIESPSGNSDATQNLQVSNPTPPGFSSIQESSENLSSSPGVIIVIAVLPVFLLIAVVFFVQVFRKN